MVWTVISMSERSGVTVKNICGPLCPKDVMKKIKNTSEKVIALIKGSHLVWDPEIEGYCENPSTLTQTQTYDLFELASKSR